tara:strand:- start:476 stop:835 length:360 start_codon:yes stop_codon:yes gene_type:complete
MIKDLENRVRQILEEIPSSRDSDTILVTLIWDDELGGARNTQEMSGFKLLSMISRGDVCNYESISRCRRKIQEGNKALRGAKWDARHRIADQVKEEIKHWNDTQGDMFPGTKKRKINYG